MPGQYKEMNAKTMLLLFNSQNVLIKNGIV